MTERRDSDSWVRRVSEDTARYTRDLLRENQRLREVAARLEVESKRLRDELDHHVDRHRRERTELEQQLRRLEADSRKYLEHYLEVEQQNTNLANLYVASFRLHSTLARREVLAGIDEIIINLIGSEELALIEIDEQSGRPHLTHSFGLESNSFTDLPDTVRRRIESCMHSGEIWVRGAEDFPMTACIPLKVDHDVIGAIAIFRLLEQKTGVEPVDHELFSLLATNASTALYCSHLHASRGRAVQA
jgi:hypothetical protein